jgi:hypothetical protein
MDWENIKYQGNFFNYIPLGLFNFIVVGAFVFFFLIPGTEALEKNSELELVLIITAIMVSLIFAASTIGILLVFGNTTSFIIRKGIWPSEKSKIEVKINDVLEWRETKLPWYALLRKDKEGKTYSKGEIDSRSYNAVEIRVRDGDIITFRCRKPLEFIDYLKKMKLQVGV